MLIDFYLDKLNSINLSLFVLYVKIFLKILLIYISNFLLQKTNKGHRIIMSDRDHLPRSNLAFSPNIILMHVSSALRNSASFPQFEDPTQEKKKSKQLRS